MRKPNDSLDEFVVKAQDTTTEPPSPVSLHFTGEVEVLKPLALFGGPAKSEAATADTRPYTEPNGLSWFHRSLIAGGAFAIGAIVLASAIFIGIYEGPGDQSTEVAGASEVSEVPGVTEVAGVSEVPDSEIRIPQSEIRNQSDSQSAIRNRKSFAFKPRRQQHRSQFVKTNFVPTTLVIFIERGEIKTRIEPQLTTDYKKPLTFSN